MPVRGTMACANSNAAAVPLSCDAAFALVGGPINKAHARLTVASGNFVARFIWRLSQSNSQRESLKQDCGELARGVPRFAAPALLASRGFWGRMCVCGHNVQPSYSP